MICHHGRRMQPAQSLRFVTLGLVLALGTGGFGGVSGLLAPVAAEATEGTASDSVAAGVGGQVAGTQSNTEAFSAAAPLNAASILSEPEWAHETVTDGTATAWVEQDVSLQAGATLRLRGTGWTTQAGSEGSTVAIKLNSGPLTQYSRSGASIISHPSAGGESTIWALLAPDNPTGHPGVHAINEAGEFDISIDLPEGLVAGQEFTVRFQSGLFVPGDTQRTLTTAPLVVGGVPYVDDGGEALATCVPSTPQPTVTVAERATLGGTLLVSGTGWCHPAEAGGGSRIAFKIDEGGFSHLTADIHSNRTIWALVDADDETGDWSFEMQLPDGTEATSLPAFTEGAHTLRLLTGSLKEGDAGRTMKSAEFVVGEYAPTVLPDPLGIDSGALSDETLGGVKVEQRLAMAPGSWLVTVPEGNIGEWVYVDVYVASSSRAPFPSWYRLDDKRQVLLSLDGVTLPVGATKATVQSGDQGRVGDLLGWAAVEIKSTEVTPPPVVPPAPVVTAVLKAAPASAAAPLTVPAAPVSRGSQLTSANVGYVKSELRDGIVTLTVPGSAANDWVYAFVYTGAEVRPIGWVQLDEALQVKIDVSELPAGNHKVALVSAGGELIGWAPATTGTTKAAVLDTSKSETRNASERAKAVVLEAQPAAEGWPVDLMLVGGALIVLAGAVSAAVVIRSKRKA